jgi:hypothetical protein
MKPRFFSHDFDAGRDIKILKMRTKWGAQGVGLYWLTIEYLFSVGGYGDLEDLEIIALYMSESLDIIQDFINDCITNYGLSLFSVGS